MRGQNAHYYLIWDDFYMAGVIVEAGMYRIVSATTEEEAESFVTLMLENSPWCKSYRYEVW